MSRWDSELLVSGDARHPDRRQFLKSACSLAASVAAARFAGKAPAEGVAAKQSPRRLPQIPFGPHSVSRLIAGGNPPAGGSRQTRLMDMHCREYFTFERTVELLHRCHAQGINTWQISYRKKLVELMGEPF